MIYSLTEIASICQGEHLGEDREVDHFVTDSRRLHSARNSLFIALVGPRHDGHDFIQQAIDSGVQAFLVQRKMPLPENCSQLVVADTLSAFQTLAAHHRSSCNYPVIGITGSYGKTSVKELLASILQRDFQIVRSPKSYNSQTGVPLSIMDMESDHDLAILEAGISRPGEMERLARMIRPDIGILTGIGAAHDRGFSDRQEKLQEKLDLFTESSIIIYPRDVESIHQAVMERFGRSDVELAHWGRTADAFIHIVDLKKDRSGIELTYCTGGASKVLQIQDSSERVFQNLMTTITVCHILGLSADQVEERIHSYHLSPDRSIFLSSFKGRGLLTDIRSFDGPALRTAKEQLSSLSKAKDLLVLLCNTSGGKLDNDQRIAELRSELKDCRTVLIGTGWEKLGAVLPTSISIGDVSGFKDRMEELIQPDTGILLMGEWSPELIRLQSLLQEQSHQTILHVNLHSLVHNLNVFRSLLKPGTQVMAMVKAFAYGSGESEVARILEYHQVDYLAVAYVDEAVSLRNSGVQLPIMVMNSASSEFSTIIEHRIEPELFSLEMIASFIQFVAAQGLTDYPVHLKVDTGMHRLGIDPHELETALDQVKKSAAVRLQSVFSHLYASDADDLSSARSQLDTFTGIQQRVSDLIDYPVMFHIANSAAISRLPEAHLDMVRLGIGLYGHTADESLAADLLPVLSWHTHINQVKRVVQGETIGYGGELHLQADTRIAIIPVGYADGLSRTLGNGVGAVYIHGKACPFIGNICMDMSMVDIGESDVNPGDEVEILGPNMPLEEIAERMGTIPYEVLTSIPPRIKRRFTFTG
ncbi:MAG: bifunctional UDP-N-acetylmuramoyl-tripeptide:D-alanyl-D-alanine ligase/alanine racemase [Flavobacteriales bacterium]|nr:bifunctional UDP-N-acetylmuramoyl-tripeptide:D-alanyl-D-alanine ligase/alanine racemase [Flavobacteriales bacterium]